jgi:hypothetical protein
MAMVSMDSSWGLYFGVTVALTLATLVVAFEFARVREAFRRMGSLV